MFRISLKIVGASGQGINSIGAIIAKGLKRSGYCVFGYREYPSLIKGGHASYQLDASNERICSTETKVNVLVALNHHGLELNMDELKQGGIVLHVTPAWQFPEHHRKLIAERSLRVIYFPVDDILNRLGAKAILSNVLLTAFVSSARSLRRRKLCLNSTCDASMRDIPSIQSKGRSPSRCRRLTRASPAIF
jgi:2-oxoglutarate/2-oxoacid ferredoxin oxidoreductase subunit alpha